MPCCKLGTLHSPSRTKSPLTTHPRSHPEHSTKHQICNLKVVDCGPSENRCNHIEIKKLLHSLQRKVPLPGEEELQKEDTKSSQDLQTIGTRTPEDSDQRSRSESQSLSCTRVVRDRISLGTIIVDARVRARSSIFVSSGVSILEGGACLH